MFDETQLDGDGIMWLQGHALQTRKLVHVIYLVSRCHTDIKDLTPDHTV